MSSGSDNFRTVAIIGLGLLGGSLASTLRWRSPQTRVIAYARRQETLDTALAGGMIHGGSTDPCDVLPEADLTVICIPLQATVDFARQYTDLWKNGSIVTDVGSVKSSVVKGVREHLEENGIYFVGSHPMAGSEQGGIEHSDRNLYKGAVVFITPFLNDPPEIVAKLKIFWQHAGAEVHEMAPDAHDFLVARTSHALHLVSSAAVKCYLQSENSHLATGGAFRDFTRIAGSSPHMWCEIVEHNRENVLQALTELTAELDGLKRLISQNNWNGLFDYLAGSRELREIWVKKWQERQNSSN